MLRKLTLLFWLCRPTEFLHLLGSHQSISVFLSLPLLRRRQAVCRNNRELLYLNSPISIFYLVDLAARIMVSFPRILSFPFPSRKQFGSIASVFGAGQRPQYLCRLKSALRIRRRASGYEFFLPLESFIPFHRLITLSILIGTSFENHSFLPSFLSFA